MKALDETRPGSYEAWQEFVYSSKISPRSEVDTGNGCWPLELDGCPDVAWLCTAGRRGGRVILSESMAFCHRSETRWRPPPWRLCAHVVPTPKFVRRRRRMDATCAVPATAAWPGFRPGKGWLRHVGGPRALAGHGSNLEARRQSKGGGATQPRTDAGIRRLKGAQPSQVNNSISRRVFQVTDDQGMNIVMEKHTM
ncbi:hypothetical protein PMIN01_00298 [Paraphaeosphaeria minitans]|uniref:Uncharacterized protein n=1 Tax=Paraphaeosphaeria minitans TaxID=565426 RepID=A0A9P6GSI5_9PLEO|nr:hypothetical protein PMIN01_00298 [Paraphaeosphaeria minitans]